jgi:large subunit ribosomal protein L10
MKGPTISIAEDKVVARKGEVITKAVAGALSKLNIKPIKVGLSVVACIEKGQVFTADELDFDADEVGARFASAHQNAINLAVEIEHFTRETTELLLIKAYRSAKAVSAEAKIGGGCVVPETSAAA